MGGGRLLKEGGFSDAPEGRGRERWAQERPDRRAGPILGGRKDQAAGMLRETTRSRSQAPMVQPTR